MDFITSTLVKVTLTHHEISEIIANHLTAEAIKQNPRLGIMDGMDTKPLDRDHAQVEYTLTFHDEE